MNSYLIVCGVILNIFILAAIILLPIVIILDKRTIRKNMADRARQFEEYKKELEQAKPIWEKWEKDFLSLNKNYFRAKTPEERYDMELARVEHMRKAYYVLTGRRVYLPDVAAANNWSLPEEKTAKSA